jgi:lysyl-tRNA synthetase class I
LTREQLADWLCENVRRKRLERIGEPVDAVAYAELHAEERQPWLDVAEAVIELVRSGELYEEGRFSSEQERLDSLDELIRMIVNADAPSLMHPERREVLIGHLTGAVYVHTRP